MKKLLLILVSVFTLHSVAIADDGVPVTVNQLPATAQRFIKSYFGTSEISYARMEMEWTKKKYEVLFDNGSKVEFDHKGNWTEVKCKSTRVPDSLVPKAIRNYVSANYPGRRVQQMQRDGKYFEVELDNGLEITFNKNFKVVKIDD